MQMSNTGKIEYLMTMKMKEKVELKIIISSIVTLFCIQTHIFTEEK
jgi:hypothetical protein